MNLDLTETQTLLCDTVREYLERELPYDNIRELDREHHWDEVLWQAICEQGWLALPFGEAHGGSGSLVEAGLLVEQFSRRAAVIPIAEVVAAGRVIEAFASADVAARCIGDLVAGRRRIVPAISADGVAVRADADGALTGETAFVGYGQFASDHLVAVQDATGPALYLVDATRDEVDATPLHSIGRTPLARVRYAGAPAQRIGGAEACA